MIGSWRNRRMPQNNANDTNSSESSSTGKKAFLSRDLFLPRDIQELKDDLPPNCKFIVPNPSELFKLELLITPLRESMWYGGKFRFAVEIPPDYKYTPPKVRCLTKIYHPNINESGEICLSILRLSFDETGWLPTRSLKDVVCGLNSLFTDLLNFEDPLNSAAADHYIRDPRGFAKQVKTYIERYCQN